MSVIIIILAATLGTFVLALLFIKNIVTPLTDIYRVNEAIAKGDLRSTITFESMAC